MTDYGTLINNDGELELAGVLIGEPDYIVVDFNPWAYPRVATSDVVRGNQPGIIAGNEVSQMRAMSVSILVKGTDQATAMAKYHTLAAAWAPSNDDVWLAWQIGGIKYAALGRPREITVKGTRYLGKGKLQVEARFLAIDPYIYAAEEQVIVAATEQIIGGMSFGTAVSGTAQAGASTTITLASGASAQDNYYNGWVIRTTGGDAAGEPQQVRRITDYNGTTKVATIDVAWATNPTSATLYSTTPGTALPLAFGDIISGRFTVENLGSVAAGSWQARLYGPLTDPELVLVDTGERIRLSMTIADDDYVEIDARWHTMYLNGSSNLTQVLVPGSTWFKIPVGESQLLLQTADTGDTGRIELSFRDAYL